MKTGTQVYIKETNQIGTIYDLKNNGLITKVKVGDKIIDVADKTVVILTMILKIIQFIKSIIK
jgi:hypothetical protein